MNYGILDIGSCTPDKFFQSQNRNLEVVLSLVKRDSTPLDRLGIDRRYSLVVSTYIGYVIRRRPPLNTDSINLLV